MRHGAGPRAVSRQARHAWRQVQAGEFGPVALACCAFFLILCAYYILRPVRDTMAVQYGAGRLQWLFSATFVFTLLIVPVFGWVVRRVPRAYVLPLVYGFLIVNLLGFHAAFAEDAGTLAAAMFFIWLSVFNLFVVSLFWSAVSDCFSTAESHRFYGYIAAGGTAGALAGPALSAFLARHASTAHFLALSAALLMAAAVCMLALRRKKIADGQAERRPLGGSIAAGIPQALKSQSLRGIVLMVLCYTTVSTVLYVELVDQAGHFFAGRSEQTRFFAGVDLAVNLLALALQMLGTRRLVHRFGLRFALSAVPALMITGLGPLGASSVMRNVFALAAMQTAHRSGEYALGKPAREMIYTTVDAERRYKAKNFIDTAVYRAGDAAAGWVIAAVRSAGFDTIVFVALPAALLWLATGFRLGARHDKDEST